MVGLQGDKIVRSGNELTTNYCSTFAFCDSAYFALPLR